MSCAPAFVTTVKFHSRHARCDHVVTFVEYRPVVSMCSDKKGRLRACRERGSTNGVAWSCTNEYFGRDITFGKSHVTMFGAKFRLISVWRRAPITSPARRFSNRATSAFNPHVEQHLTRRFKKHQIAIQTTS